ncbi:GNAT family N-acetyltransferase [Plantibacter sp. YIM 135249]|uniref:GNAT family N-acetyltransferase n=1 Tax=Plantibacter sp. YIM 135249 TaxID=3423918 RepID=UPI003D336F65
MQQIDTGRLVLEPLTEADLSEMFAVYSDPRTWAHLPSHRHRHPDETARNIANTTRSRHLTGLGMWAMRVGPEAADDELPEGTFIGTGGVVLVGPDLWNLGYRLSPRAWGRGFATAVSRAATEAAAEVAPDRAVTARVLSNNPASERVVRKVGLSLVWEGVSSETEATSSSPAPPVMRRAFADRELSPDATAWLIAMA